MSFLKMPFLFIYVIFQSSSLLQESVMIFTYISWVCEPGTFLDVLSIVVVAIAESRLWAYPSSSYVSPFFDSKFLSRTYTNSFGFILVFVVQSMYLYLTFFYCTRVELMILISWLGDSGCGVSVVTDLGVLLFYAEKFC